MTARTAPVQDAAMLVLMGILGSAANLLSTYLLAHFWGPAVYGQWQILITLMWYCTLLDLGVNIGIFRDVPYFLGQKDPESYRRTAGTVFVWNLFLSGLFVILFLTLGPALFQARDLRAGLGLLGLFMVVFCFSNYHQNLLYAHQGLRVWGIAAFLRNFFRLVAAGLLFSSGVEAVLGGWILAEFPLIFLVRWANAGIAVHWTFSRQVFRRLLLLGFPGFLLTLAQWQSRIGDRGIVAMFLGEQAVGYYGLASTFSSSMVMIAIQVSQTMQPRILRRYGETQDVMALKEHILEPGRAVGLVFPFLIGLAVLGIPLFIRWFLPAYAPAVPISLALCVASFFLAAAPTQATLLLALQRLWLSTGLWCVVLAVNLGLNFILLRRGWGMQGVAIGTSVSWVVAFLVQYAATLHYHVDLREGIRYLAGVLAPFLYSLGVLGAARWALSRTVRSEDVRTGLELTVFVLAYAPLLWKANRTYGAWPALVDYFQGWKARIA